MKTSNRNIKTIIKTPELRYLERKTISFSQLQYRTIINDCKENNNVIYHIKIRHKQTFAVIQEINVPAWKILRDSILKQNSITNEPFYVYNY